MLLRYAIWLTAAWSLFALDLGATQVRAGSLGYVIVRTSSGIALKTGPESANKATQLALPLHVRRVVVENVPADLRARSDAMVREVRIDRVSDLFALAQTLEAAHKEAGYALARLYLPNQVIRTGGVARLQVINVRLDALDLSALPPPLAARLHHHLDPLLEQSFLRTETLARAVGLAQLEFGVPLQTTPVPSDRADRLALRVTGPLRSVVGEINAGGLVSRPFTNAITSGAATAFLPPDLGGRLTISGALGTRTETPSFNGPLFTAAALWGRPLDWPMDAFTEVGVVGARVLRKSAPLAMGDVYEFGRVFTRLGVPVIVSGPQSLILKIGPDVTAESLLSRGAVPYLFADNDAAYTGVLRGEAIWIGQQPGGLGFEAALVGTVGQTVFDRRVTVGTDRAVDRDPHAIGLVAGRVRITAPIPWDSVLTFNARAQFSALGPLPLSEQFQLFRAIEATAYDPETSQGDSGIYARVDLGHRFDAPWLVPGASVTPYMFGGGGAIWQTVTPFKQRLVTGETWGVGTQLALPPGELFPLATVFTAELFRQISTDSVPNYTGLTLRASVKF